MSNSTTDGSMLPISYVMSQQFTILDLYNQTTNFTLADLNSYRQYALVNSIIFSSQLGACAAILVILLMLTKQEKRRTTVFALNSLALLFNITGCLLECLYYTGSWYSPYAYLTSDYSMVSASAHSVSIAPGIFVILVVLCLEASLVLQVSVVCVTFSSAQRLAINIASGLVAGITVGFRVAQVAINIKCNIDAAAEACGNNQWLANAMAITQTVSICYFSAVFCGKLGWSLHQRRKMGMTQFGPMQIIFIGGAQTLVVPALFAILQFAIPTLPEIGSNVLTITIVSLPLSSLWATASTSKPSKAARGPDAHQKFILSSTTADTTVTSSSGYGRGGGSGSGSGSRYGGRAVGADTGVGVPSSFDARAEETTPRLEGFGEKGVEKDLEMQELGRE